MAARRFELCARLPKAPWKWLRRGLCLAGAFLLAASASSKEGMDSKTRIDIIRGLLREVAVTKIPLPRGKRGVYVDRQGKLDQADAQKEIRTNGLAMQAGTPAEITKIEFKSSEVVFEINGGGKSGKKWYQHIEIDGVPTVTTEDENAPQQNLAFGSSITLDYGQALPDLSVAQLKQILSGTLDFARHTPTVLYSPNLPPQFKQAIKDHKVVVGMDRDAVLSAKGSPDRRVREVRDGVEQEDWIYGNPPHVLFVTFDGDQVVSVKQY